MSAHSYSPAQVDLVSDFLEPAALIRASLVLPVFLAPFLAFGTTVTFCVVLWYLVACGTIDMTGATFSSVIVRNGSLDVRENESRLVGKHHPDRTSCLLTPVLWEQSREATYCYSPWYSIYCVLVPVDVRFQSAIGAENLIWAGF